MVTPGGDLLTMDDLLIPCAGTMRTSVNEDIFALYIFFRDSHILNIHGNMHPLKITFKIT